VKWKTGLSLHFVLDNVCGQLLIFRQAFGSSIVESIKKLWDEVSSLQLCNHVALLIVLLIIYKACSAAKEEKERNIT
jgi:hypothetical protein